MRRINLVELLLDGWFEFGDLLRGRKRRLAALFVAAVLVLSPETYLRAAMARAKPMLDAVNDLVLDSVGEYRSLTPIDPGLPETDAP